MHHSRRKSGNTSMMEKTVTATDPSRYGKRPSTLTRRQTPQKLGKNPRDREREREQQDSWDDERESFPQFCMTCEKQFVPQDDRFLYCSESCRKLDQQTASTGRTMSQPHMGNYPFYAACNPEPRDIVPRASPSRPNSMHFSPPTTPGATTGAQYSSAISALRSLSIRPPSPPSPTSSHASIWPFTKSSTNSPSTSYNRGSNSFFPATYDGGYAANGYAYNYSSSGMDRPLPTRRPTGPGYSRPKSIELVTPMVGR
ncbi:hypothetical protein CFIO01_11362 [Colletotrichum fioriniae PJ7]|uniref:Life-span regulatory factor n=1 Tax=Colletotrichum fioriniae PJ7 TaxID=1445577 RepID=A0A010QI25_9PEZI|nr:hypothetical protein CFIO01_11362 [Colletotrichum fioriniae PJ7]